MRGTALADLVLDRLGRLSGTAETVEISSAHVDGCLYHGQASLDFARALLEGGATVSVPTTLNVSSLDLLHPERYRGDAETAARARELMDAYVEMGCRPTWTCAPYELVERPSFGQHVAWAESNAIAFANSVLGARTERYGDFVDIAAAIVGRVPFAGLHRDEGRAATVVVRLEGVPERLLEEDVLYPVLGLVLGRIAGSAVPAIDGLPPGLDEDRLKALGAAAASSGAVAMFHAVGVTPEAPTLDEALRGRRPERIVEIRPSDLASARDELCTAPDGPLGAVSIGTPHLSVHAFETLADLLDGERVDPGVRMYLNVGRDVLGAAERRGWVESVERAGAILVADTCTYVTPIIGEVAGPVMTDSAKWAFYAPGNLGVDVVFGSLEECVRSAVLGRVWRDDGLWG